MHNGKFYIAETTNPIMDMLLAYIYDFLSFVFEKHAQDDVKRVIAYGHALQPDSQEDARIFIEVWNPHKAAAVEKEVQDRLRAFEEKAVRFWQPRGVTKKIDVSAGNLDSSEWAGMKEEVLSDGLVLYGRREKHDNESLEHRELITFSLATLGQNDKMKLIRKLYGYEVKKSGKKYSISGLVEECGGKKLSSNSILVPAQKAAEIKNVLLSFKIAAESKEVWA